VKDFAHPMYTVWYIMFNAYVFMDLLGQCQHLNLSLGTVTSSIFFMARRVLNNRLVWLNLGTKVKWTL